MVVSGDTGYDEGLASFAGGADLFVMECSFPYETPYHLYPSACAALAEKSGAKKVLLTHFYPSLDVAEAVRTVAEGGVDVVAAEDLLMLTL